MGDTKVIGSKVEVSSLAGPLWIGGWLFTIGYLHFHLWKAVLALIVWPYFLGAALGH